MSEPFVGQLKMFAGNFAPRGWSFCDGQLLSVAQNDALFSLLGTTYGGDGRTTFGLPDMRGRIPIHVGTGPGLSPRALGSKGGTETEDISEGQLPSHTHPMHGSTESGTDPNPEGNALATSVVVTPYFALGETDDMAASAIAATGGGGTHTNIAPYLAINYIIALFGVFPSRQ